MKNDLAFAIIRIDAQRQPTQPSCPGCRKKSAHYLLFPARDTLFATGACSSAEEHRTSNPTVGGSNPPRRIPRTSPFCCAEHDDFVRVPCGAGRFAPPCRENIAVRSGV